MKAKRGIVAVLAAMLVISAVGCQGGGENTSSQSSQSSTSGDVTSSDASQGTTTGTDYPDYLNLDSALPLANETQKMSIVVYQRSGQGKADDIWFWEYARQEMNIDFDVTQVTSSAEYKSTAFATDSLPDIWFQMFLTSVEQLTYGEREEQLIDLSGYINETLTPNMMRIYNEYPEYLGKITSPPGAIYSLGGITNPKSAAMTFYINKQWLEEANMELPTTLEDFTAAMEAFKQRGSDIVPMAGDAGDSTRYLLNAFGYVTHAAESQTTIAMRNGQPVIPAGDREVFGEYLKTVAEYYEKGYLSQDLYTIDNETTRALMQNGKIGFGQSSFISFAPNNETEWSAAPFLTSEYNDTAKVASNYNSVSNQSFAISHTCKTPELAMRFVDWWFDYDNYHLAIFGPTAEQEDLFLGKIDSGWTYATDDEDDATKVYPAVEDGSYPTAGEYHYAKIQGIIGGYVGLCYDLFEDSQYRSSPASNTRGEQDIITPQITDEYYPVIQFFTDEQNTAITDLSSVINAYIKENVAEFVTGKRAVTDEELTAYFDGLDAIGFQEYLQYYVDYYNDVYLPSVQ